MSAIKVENLAYSYPGLEPGQNVRVFEDLDLQIEQGTFVAILGSNGSGKSTLAKHFNAILLFLRKKDCAARPASESFLPKESTGMYPGYGFCI